MSPLFALATPPSPSGAGATTASPPFSDWQTTWLTIGLLILVLAVLATPVVLYRMSRLAERRPGRRQAADRSGGSTSAVRDFFQTPFITWFLLHYCIAAILVIIIAMLAIDRVLDGSVVSALIGGITGAVLVNASRGGTTSTTPGSISGSASTSAAAGTTTAAGQATSPGGAATAPVEQLPGTPDPGAGQPHQQAP